MASNTNVNGETEKGVSSGIENTEYLVAQEGGEGRNR